MRGRGVRKYNIFSFGHQMGICAKNYKNLPSRFFMGINWLKANRPHPRDYLQTPTDYRHTDNHP